MNARVVSLALVVVATRDAAADVASPFRRVLLGGHGGGHGARGRGPEGWFVGAEAGWARLIGDPTPTLAHAAVTLDRDGWGFAARAGFQTRSGLAVQVRYDHDGVGAPDGRGQLAFVSAGVRYALPTIPTPFAEVMVGPALHDGDASFAAGVGLGVAVFATRHLAFELAVRDWVADLGGVHHVPSVMVGVTAGFGGS